MALAQAVVNDQFQGGAATHWVDDWPADGTGHADAMNSAGHGIDGWPSRDYVDPSQNSQYSDRHDARTNILFGETLPDGVLEAQQALSAWMDQMYLRDMTFEEMMETRRQAERDRLATEANMREAANARRKAEMLAKLRGAGLKEDEWDWIKMSNVPPDGDLADPLYCHGLTYEQCNYKISRQDFLVMESTPVNMTEYMYANNLTANYTEYVYKPTTHWADQQMNRPNRNDYYRLCANRGTGLGNGPGQSRDQTLEECEPEMTVYVGDTVHFRWQSFGTVHVSKYFPDPDQVIVDPTTGQDLCSNTFSMLCPGGSAFPPNGQPAKQRCCPIGNNPNPAFGVPPYPYGMDDPNCPANFYFDSGDLANLGAGDGVGNDPDAVPNGDFQHTFTDISQAGTYCVGSRDNNRVFGNRLVVRVKVNECDASKVGRGSPCDPPSAPPLCNATLNKATHPKWRTLTGLQQYKLDYLWNQNFTRWNNEIQMAGTHTGKFTGAVNVMPLYPIAAIDGAGDGTFDGETTLKPGFLYNMTQVPPAYVNYSVIPGYLNLTSGEWEEEQYVNGTWLNESWVCEDQIVLIPNRMPCWTGYFKRVSNTGVHSGHPSGASFACLEPSNIYDTVAPYYYDQLNEWKDEQLMYPPIVWELIETLEARGIKTIVDQQPHMDAIKDYPGYPHCGYGVQSDFQPGTDIYACFIPAGGASQLPSTRRRISPGGWHRENWGYDKRFAPGDPSWGKMGNKHDATSEFYRRSSRDYHDAKMPQTVPRKRTRSKLRPYVYPDYVRRQGAQAYYDNLKNVDPLYIPGDGNPSTREALHGGNQVGPRYPSHAQQNHITGGPFINPRNTWGGTTDHHSYADGGGRNDGRTERYGETDYEGLLAHDERPRGSQSTRPSQYRSSMPPDPVTNPYP